MSNTQHATIRKPRALVIEDEPFCRRLIGILLEGHGVEAHFAESTEEGLERLEAVAPDVIFVDLVLPGLDGIAAISAIRHRAGFDRIPIVVTTSLDDRFSSIEAREAGATGYLVKPILPEQLDEVVGKYLGES